MIWLFWSAVALVGYTYLGYPALLWLCSRLRPRPVRRGRFTASISIVMVVRNEAAVLQRKLANLKQLSYPAELTEIIVVSDGSSDDTDCLLSEFGQLPRVRVILNPLCRGKAAGLNDALHAACGEVVVFVDARQAIETDAVRLLLENLADPTVGCVSGELMLGEGRGPEVAANMGLYWKIEKYIREMESLSGSVIGATGALYAVRRSLIANLPYETILDDVYIPMHALQMGGRVVVDPRARAWDVVSQGVEREFARKVRTLSGNYQLLRLAPWLLTSANPVLFRFVSHKLMRLLVPFALGALFVSCLLMSGAIYRLALALQFVFYGLSAWAIARLRRGHVSRLAATGGTFVLLNAAATLAFANFITGRRIVWARKA